MAKQVYKIPYTLDASYGDMEIALQSKNGTGVKPMPIKVILTYVCSALLCMYMVMKTFVSNGTLLQQIIFVALWVCMTVLLAKYDKTKRMQAMLVPVFAEYLPKANRHIVTRRSAMANGFRRICGISNIAENGMVNYVDGTCAYWYRVVGSASLLLFDEDRDAIIQRVDSFYRKIGTDVEVIFVTAKESQKVYRQIAAMKRRYDKLEVRDPELLELADQEFRVLKNDVGGSFRSIHQYMIVKGDNREALTVGKNVLQSEVENSSRMIKQCVALYEHDIDEVLQTVYRGGA